MSSEVGSGTPRTGREHANSLGGVRADNLPANVSNVCALCGAASLPGTPHSHVNSFDPSLAGHSPPATQQAPFALRK